MPKPYARANGSQPRTDYLGGAHRLRGRYLCRASFSSASFSPHPITNIPINIGISTFIAEKILPHHPDSDKIKGSSLQSHCSPSFHGEILRLIETKKTTLQHHSRHRENIVRIGSLSVFRVMSVIAVFPQKTGDFMFVGFDSQNTSLSFPDYHNWNLWVWRISLIGLRGWSEN